MVKNSTQKYTFFSYKPKKSLFAKKEKDMIINVFDLGDSKARDIMIPRIDMVMFMLQTVAQLKK